MAVVGSFEAMVTKRHYRSAFSVAKASEEIRKNSGRQFDPKIVGMFLKILRRKDIVHLIKKEMREIKKRRTI